MDLSNLLTGITQALTGYNVLFAFIGALLGTLVGVLPGLGPATTMAVLLPLTYGFPASASIIMMAGIFYGAMYGGSTTSILVRVPGEVASVVTTFDGYEMAKQGRAGPALATAAVGSFIAGIFTTIMLMVLAEPIVNLSLHLGSIEYTAIIFFALCTIVTLTGKSLLKGIIVALFGLALTTIGIDLQTGVARYTFGNIRLLAGLNIIVFAIGMFGVAEVLINARRLWEGKALKIERAKRLWMNKDDLRRSAGPYARGSLLGFICGVLPLGPAISSVLSYTLEKRVSKHPEEFGHGAIEGVAGPETANNAAVGGSLLPLLAMGIPTSVGIGIIMLVFEQHGLQPGPLLFTKQPVLVWTIIASMFVGNAMLLVLNLPMVRIFIKVLHTPAYLLWPLVLALCCLGSYVLDFSTLDLFMMLCLGILGYIMAKLEFPVAPLLLAMLLGERLESYFRQSLALSRGSALVFVTHPISISFLVLGILFITFPFILRLIRHRR